MNVKSIVKDSRRISIIATIIMFLALIRCVSEPFRLQYYSVKALTFIEIKPFLIGALVTSLALLIMTILAFLGRYKLINVICIMTIVVLFIIKALYMVP